MQKQKAQMYMSQLEKKLSAFRGFIIFLAEQT